MEWGSWVIQGRRGQWTTPLGTSGSGWQRKHTLGWSEGGGVDGEFRVPEKEGLSLGSVGARVSQWFTGPSVDVNMGLWLAGVVQRFLRSGVRRWGRLGMEGAGVLMTGYWYHVCQHTGRLALI